MDLRVMSRWLGGGLTSRLGSCSDISAPVTLEDVLNGQTTIAFLPHRT
jgi:hypothetical protein